MIWMIPNVRFANMTTITGKTRDHMIKAEEHVLYFERALLPFMDSDTDTLRFFAFYKKRLHFAREHGKIYSFSYDYFAEAKKIKLK